MSPLLRAPPPHSVPSSANDMTSATTPRLTSQRQGAVRADADLHAIIRLRRFHAEHDDFRIVRLQVELCIICSCRSRNRNAWQLALTTSPSAALENRRAALIYESDGVASRLQKRADEGAANSREHRRGEDPRKPKERAA